MFQMYIPNFMNPDTLQCTFRTLPASQIAENERRGERERDPTIISQKKRCNLSIYCLLQARALYGTHKILTLASGFVHLRKRGIFLFFSALWKKYWILLLRAKL